MRIVRAIGALAVGCALLLGCGGGSDDPYAEGVFEEDPDFEEIDAGVEEIGGVYEVGGVREVEGAREIDEAVEVD